MIGEELVFLSFLYIKLFELGVEVALNYRAQCSPSIPLLLASYLLAPTGGKTQSPDCALRIPVSHDRRRACLFVLLVYQAF